LDIIFDRAHQVFAGQIHGGRRGGKRAWVADVEKKLGEADASVGVSRWQRHSIYRVPACIQDLNTKAYRPQVVSLGPFQNGDDALLPMEEHKRRALGHLLRRAKKPLEKFATAVEEVAAQLERAYVARARERFLRDDDRRRVLRARGDGGRRREERWL
jgi:hypothetical protein